MKLIVDVPDEAQAPALKGGWKAVERLGYTQSQARTISWIVKHGRVAKPGEIAPRDQLKVNGTKTGDLEVTTTSANIKTLEDALEYAQVDLDTYEVDRWVVNPWEVTMGRKNTATGKAETYTNFQVKVWLRRKTPQQLGNEAFLEEIRESVPAMPKIKHVTKGDQPRRALEIDIMDPHFGLLCSPPEADGSWDLEIAERTLFTALDDLIEKAKAFGPFEQVFIPFGNDFVHTDDVFHRTTAGTLQPEAISWHKVYQVAKRVAVAWVNRLREVAPSVYVYQVPGNHSRMADFSLGCLLDAYFHETKDVTIDCSASPYKFHRFGRSLIGFEHGHSINPQRLAALMANERPQDWAETTYREWHLGDQHRKSSAKPSTFEEQGVSVEYLCALVVPNEWHRLKAFNHQKKGGNAFIWDFDEGLVSRVMHNINNLEGAA